jgi:hypothetical protein
MLLGQLQPLAESWIISDPQGGQLPACEADLDLLLNDALARIRPTAASASRSGVPEFRQPSATGPTHQRPAVDKRRLLSQPDVTVDHMTGFVTIEDRP